VASPYYELEKSAKYGPGPHSQIHFMLPLTLFIILLQHWISFSPLNPTQIKQSTPCLRSLCKLFALSRIHSTLCMASFSSSAEMMRTFISSEKHSMTILWELGLLLLFSISATYLFYLKHLSQICLLGLQLGFCFLFFPRIYLVHQGKDFACLPYSVPRMAPGTQQIFNNYMLNV